MPRSEFNGTYPDINVRSNTLDRARIALIVLVFKAEQDNRTAEVLCAFTGAA
jgi:hypothetical protein